MEREIKSGISNEIISQIDLFNSISAIVGADYRSKDGIDLSKLITDNQGKGREILFLRHRQGLHIEKETGQ